MTLMPEMAPSIGCALGLRCELAASPETDAGIYWSVEVLEWLCAGLCRVVMYKSRRYGGHRTLSSPLVGEWQDRCYVGN